MDDIGNGITTGSDGSIYITGSAGGGSSGDVAG